MKSRFIILLLLLNAAALGAVFVLFSRHWERAAREKAGEVARKELAVWQAKASARPRVVQAVVYKTNAFQWSQLESADYRQYIANLRAVGCPESTIKDIIMTDVMRLYAARRGKYYNNGRPFKFWETDDKRKLKQGQIEEREKQLALIDKELPSVLRELLGINYERELDKYFVDTEEDDRRLAFLSGDKRDQVTSLRDKYEGERERVLAQSNGGALSPDQVQQLRQIEEDRETTLRTILTPDEEEQYELTTSPTADQLRKALVGFEPTEAEFRAIFDKQQALDLAYSYQDMSDDAVKSAKAADQAKLDQDIKDQLGPDRAAQLDRAENPDYQSLVVLTARFDLPPQMSQTLLDMRQTAEDEKRQILSTQGLPPDKMAEALKAVQSETEREAREALGDKAYAEYSQNGGGWIRGLGAN